MISNTSPLQYLHQLGLLHILPALVGSVTVPPAVLAELDEGRILGYSLPDPANLKWVTVRRPISTPALRLITDLGPGESEVLALALETPGSIVVLDDDLARQRGVTSRKGKKRTFSYGMSNPQFLHFLCWPGFNQACWSWQIQRLAVKTLHLSSVRVEFMTRPQMCQKTLNTTLF